MKLLICGAGRMAAELLKRLGETWEVTLVDLDEKPLGRLRHRFGRVARTVSGDASSPVILEEAGLEEQQYVVALTGSDRVNLVVCTFAREAGIRSLLARVTDPEMAGRFEEIGARPLLPTVLAARNVVQYLQDPRIRVTSIGEGEAELLDMEVAPNLALMGRPASDFAHLEWRIAGVIRQSRLFFPDGDVLFQEGDRALILGKADLYEEVCRVMECAEPHFPRTYGSSLVLYIPDRRKEDAAAMFQEAVHFANNTKVQQILALCGTEVDLDTAAGGGSGRQFDIRFEVVEENVQARIEAAAGEEGAGVVLMPPPPPGRVASLTRPATIAQAHALPCPLLFLRGTHPYEKILACFDGSSPAERGLRTALDLARQLGGDLTVAAVREPEFLGGEESRDWGASVMERARELAHIDKVRIEEVVLTGNPVRELTTLAEDYNLMVIGSGRQDKEIFSPHVGELLIRNCPCSVLVLTR